MYALPVGSPRVVPITLLRVKARALKYSPWQRAEIDVNMCKIYWIVLRLSRIAVMASQYFCKSQGIVWHGDYC